MDVTREVSEGIKIWIAGGSILLVLLWARLHSQWAVGALIALCLFGAANYARWGTRTLTNQVDSYDVIHYYLSAKYFDELGYYDLYPAVILADHEHPQGPYSRFARSYRAQDAERGYRGGRPISEALERGRIVKERFTPEKWEAFRGDFYRLQRKHKIGERHYNTMINDRGFNGTPVWTVVAAPFAKLVPVEGLRGLLRLDLILLGVALWTLFWAYESAVVPLFCLLFLVVTYSLRWPFPGQAFLRYDWVAALLAAMALLRKRRGFAAGLVAGYASLSRFFPAAWLFGPGVQGLMQLLTRRKAGPSRPPAASPWNKRLVMMGAGVLTSVVVLEGWAWIQLGGDAISTHWGNILEHSRPEELSSRRMGFVIGYMYDGSFEPKLISHAHKMLVVEQKTATRLLAILLMIGLGWGTRRLRPDESFALGFLPFFYLATFSYYYAVARITLIAWHASDLSKVRNRVGLAALFAIEMMSNWAETTYPGSRLYLIGHLSWSLIFYAVVLTGWLIWEDKKAGGAVVSPSVA